MSVFTKISHSELREHLRQFPVSELIGFQGIGEGVENTNYFVDTRDGRWVLTLFERTEEAGLPYFLGLMDHLAGHGFPCPTPLRSRDGALLTRLKDRHAALVRRLSGASVLFPTLEQCAAVGEVLGQLHVDAASFPMQRSNDRGRQWRQQTAQALMSKLANDEAELLQSELDAQANVDWSALPQGVIHADLFRDNVLFVDQRLTGVIDFYYACNDALIYDLAVTVNDWCSDADGRLNHARAAALITAYRGRREPQDSEVECWPLVLRAAALRFYLSRLQDWHLPRDGELVHIKDPAQYRSILQGLRSTNPPALT